MNQLYVISFSQGGVATLITMPLDVMKTRVMNAKPGQYAVSIISYSDDIIIAESLVRCLDYGMLS